jgi:hypothetical protein
MSYINSWSCYENPQDSSYRPTQHQLTTQCQKDMKLYLDCDNVQLLKEQNRATNNKGRSFELAGLG